MVLALKKKELMDEKDREILSLRTEVARLRRMLAEMSPSIEGMLKRRGFIVFRKEPQDDLLIPDAPLEINNFYESMKKYSFRLFLRDIIKHKSSIEMHHLTRFSTVDVIKGYLDFTLKAGIVKMLSRDRYQLARIDVKSFGDTLEWFVAEVLKREYGASAVWGVKFKNTRMGGDYDVIANVEGKLLYAEIKSSPPKQIYDSEIKTFLDRVEGLTSDISIFLMDTELRMKDKIVPMFESELSRRYGKGCFPVERMERELFHINNRIFIINTKDSISANIGKVLIWYFRSKK
ncbi:MAG: hypothetical protein AB1488_02875 [Nitrospirota bacterium]